MHHSAIKLSAAICLILLPLCALRLAAQEIVQDAAGRIRITPAQPSDALVVPWPSDLEEAYWVRANQAIDYYTQRSGNYGTTWFESEKRSYPLAMYDFLKGNRDPAIKFLQSDDAMAGDHDHTQGIDLYPCFTLKGQVRKYFFFGPHLDPDYRQRMYQAAKAWTAQDPLGRPHPKHGAGKGGEGWTPEVRGSWVDVRTTDNLRAMRDTSVYLLAEETGNEQTRLLYKDRIRRTVWALYHIGMGEWDSENYHGHSLAPFLNLFDFAKDVEVRRLAKAALDWFSAAGALKYYRGGFGGPTKRDYGGGNVVFGSGASHILAAYFGAPLNDPRPEPDQIHVITSAYRPPLAVVALANKEFSRPVEILSTKPTYENWKPGGDSAPEYWETLFLGHHYQLGTVVSHKPMFDVGTFKLLAHNSRRGVDYFIAHTGEKLDKPSKNAGDQIVQYRNLVVWLRKNEPELPLVFQLPRTATKVEEGGIWFIQLEKTWIALRPLELEPAEEIAAPSERADLYRDETFWRCEVEDAPFSGFAMEVAEPETHGDFAEFRQRVIDNWHLDASGLERGDVTLVGSNKLRLKVVHNPDGERPLVSRDTEVHNFDAHLDLYRPHGPGQDRHEPISLGWKEGTLRVRAGGHQYECSVSRDGKVSFGGEE